MCIFVYFRMCIFVQEMIAFASDKRVHVAQIQRNNPIARQFGITTGIGNSRLLLLKRGRTIPLYTSM